MTDSAAVNAALAAVRASARAARAADQRLSDITDADALIDAIATRSRITVNFHPDRLLADGRTVAESLASDGIYRAQYETGISNGSRTAFLRGDRDSWERSLFGDRHYRLVSAAERPKYGALNLAAFPDGAAPRFGSAHVRLRAAASRRATFTVGDSHLGPVDIGTLDEFRTVLGGFLHRETADGTELTALRTLAAAEASPPVGRANGRCLDDYIEAQVHGVVDLRVDAEALVLDPIFRGTPDGDRLAGLTDRLGIELGYHEGFRLAPDEFGDDFRGPLIPRFAAAIAERFGAAELDARVIGCAAADVVRRPDRWATWGVPDDLLQHFKKVWHTLVAFGRPYG